MGKKRPRREHPTTVERPVDRGPDGALTPDQFTRHTQDLADQLPKLRAAVTAPPWRPVTVGGQGTTTVGRPPVYLAAVSLLEEIPRAARRLHHDLAVSVGWCVPCQDGDWLGRLAGVYAHAHPRPRLASLVTDTSKRVQTWDDATSRALGELLEPYALRDARSRLVKCPGWPRWDTGRPTCDQTLRVVPHAVGAPPHLIQCEAGGHSWSGPRAWSDLAVDLARHDRGKTAPAATRLRVSAGGYGGAP